MSDDLCLECNTLVEANEDGLSCDGCQRWCHRTCGTGISKKRYKQLQKKVNFEWRCSICKSCSVVNIRPNFESSRRSMNDATTDRGHFTLELSGVPAIGNERSVDRGHFTLELSGVPDGAMNEDLEMPKRC